MRSPHSSFYLTCFVLTRKIIKSSFIFQVLQDIMVRYIKTIGTNIKETAELCNRNEPNLRDIERTFEDMNINMSELSEYVEQFDSKALVTDPIPHFPQPSMTRLNHLKPGSREVLHRPYHIYDYLPPIYPEMEEAENPVPSSMTSIDHDHIKDEIKKESVSTGEGSDLHPLREIASVMMTSSGFISPAREGRMADSRTPAVSKLATNNTNLFEDDSSRPGSTDSAIKSKSKTADDTSDEGLIEDDDEVPKNPMKSSGGSKLSVFQKKKTVAKTPKVPKTPKTPKDPTTSGTKKAGPGRPRGRKKKDVVAPTNVVSKEFVSSSDSDNDIELSMTPSPPPAKKAKIEPPVELKVDQMLPKPDPNILPNNPLIPKYFGFENMNLDLPKEEGKSNPPTRPTSIEPPRIKEDHSDVISSKHTEGLSKEAIASGSMVKEAKESKKEKKKDKSLKKAKKEKKEKNREKEHKKEHKDKSEKRDKEKKKKKEKQERPPSPGLFAGTDQTTTTSVPKFKIKDSKPEEPKLPKLVFKGLGGSSQGSSEKKKEAPKQPDIFSDPIHMDRPKSAASDTSDPGLKKKSKSKESKKESKEDRPRTSSGGGHSSEKREKRESAIAAEAAIHATPQESTGEPSTPTFGGGSVVTQTVGYYVDAEGNQIWICPACGKPDDGSPMIGCDECDDWYHWICVGIQQEPADNQDWFCPRCVQRKSTMFIDRKTPGKRGRPPKMR